MGVPAAQRLEGFAGVWVAFRVIPEPEEVDLDLLTPASSANSAWPDWRASLSCSKKAKESELSVNASWPSFAGWVSHRKSTPCS